MQSSYEDTVENGAREEKKRYIPRVNQKMSEKRKYLRHLVHFFLFSKEKKQNSIQIWIDRDVSLFSSCLVLVLWREKRENQPTNTNEETRDQRKLFLPTQQHRRHNRGTPLRATNSISSIR
jgi:hypothetical protein|tara:strand:+ start:2099 stop:2461 length:363 start_codon:yes stop_codon:yes gene_type:complete